MSVRRRLGVSQSNGGSQQGLRYVQSTPTTRRVTDADSSKPLEIDVLRIDVAGKARPVVQDPRGVVIKLAGRTR